MSADRSNGTPRRPTPWISLQSLVATANHQPGQPLPGASEQSRERPCVDCGYDLRGLDSLRCPECGREHTAKDFAGRSAYQRAVDRVTLRCLTIVPTLFALLASIGFALGLFLDPDTSAGIIGASASVAGIAAIFTAFRASASNLQLDLVGAPKPAALSRYPVRFLLAFLPYFCVMYLAQVMVAIVLTSAGCLVALMCFGLIDFAFDIQ